MDRPECWNKSDYELDLFCRESKLSLREDALELLIVDLNDLSQVRLCGNKIVPQLAWLVSEAKELPFIDDLRCFVIAL